MHSATRSSDTRPSSKQLLMLFPSQNDSSAGLSENSVSLKSSRSFEPPPSDSPSSHGQERSQSIPPLTSSGVETSSPGEDLQHPNNDDDSRRNAADDTVSANIDAGREARSDARYASDASLNILPKIPTSPIEITDFNRPPFSLQTGAHSQALSGPSQTGFAGPSTSTDSSVSPPVVRSNSCPTDGAAYPSTLQPRLGRPTPLSGRSMEVIQQEKRVTFLVIQHFLNLSSPSTTIDTRMTFLARNSTLSMGSPPPYYEAVNQAPVHHHSSFNVGHAGPSDPLAGPSRLSEDWYTNESRRDGPARTRVRPRPPLPIGPRRPSQGVVALPSSIGFSDSLNRTASTASMSQSSLSRQRSTRIPAIPSPKFQTPSPKWRGHTMDAARWTFKSSQLQTIVSKAIKQSSEASLIRLLEPEVLDSDIPAEIANLEALRTDIKTRYKLLARRRAVLFETLSSFLLGNTEDGSHAHRLLEELSEIAGTMDHLAEELHSADTQLTHLDSLTQVHISSALSVALRKLNASLLKQMSENENLRNDLCSLEAERDEAWSQAERIALELDQLAGTAENPSPILSLSNRSSRVSTHRKSMALASKAGLKVPKRRHSKRLSLKVTPSSPSFSSPFVSPTSSSKSARPAKSISPSTSADKKPSPVLTESTSPPVCPIYLSEFFSDSLYSHVPIADLHPPGH
jgi:hypothetical protein